MFLSQLVYKTLSVENAVRGVTLGAGVSLKSKTLKYLLCSANNSAVNPTQTDFAVPISALTDVSENAVQLSRLRAVFPKSCAKLFIGTPIYNADGVYLGKTADVEFQCRIAVRIITDKNESFPFSAVLALSDAVLLKKTQPYPLGQRIPAHVLSTDAPIVTKSVLQKAIEKRSLIKLTLSLPPFNIPPL